MQSKTAVLLAAAVLAGTGNTVGAEEPVTLAPQVVTATRYSKADIDVPATTEVMSRQEIINTGASTVQDALRFTTGVIYKANPVGESGGEFLIRGKRRGTLVMLNGVSLNFRNGYADLSAIPVEDVDRIEIVRGGGAVLYGSDATGGVINVITKPGKTNAVSVSAGNFGQQRHAVTVSEGGFSANFVIDKKGRVNNISQPSDYGKFFHFTGGTKYTGNVTYQFSDALSLRVAHSNYNYGKEYWYAVHPKGKTAESIYDSRDITRKDWQGALQYEKDGLGATFAVHRNVGTTWYTYWDYESKKSPKLIGILDRKYLYESDDRTTSFDLHKEWQREDAVLLLGGGWERSAYSLLTQDKPKWNGKKAGMKGSDGKYLNDGRFYGYEEREHPHYSRDVFSLYGSYERQLGDSNQLTLSARQTWTANSPKDKEFRQFTPQVQFLHRLSEDASWFVSYGESFTLPTMDALFGAGSAKGNVDLKPETGKHYEIGMKAQHGDALWKVAVFKSGVKNFMRLKEDKNGIPRQINEDTKNHGVELSVDVRHNENWHSNWGLVVQDPKFYDAGSPKKGWQRDYGRLQLNGGVSYQGDDWQVSLQAAYTGQRVLSSYQEEVRPLLITSLHVAYTPTEAWEVYFDADNLLNREDITSHVSSRYNAQPFNYLLGVKYRF